MEVIQKGRNAKVTNILDTKLPVIQLFCGCVSCSFLNHCNFSLKSKRENGMSILVRKTWLNLLCLHWQYYCFPISGMIMKWNSNSMMLSHGMIKAGVVFTRTVFSLFWQKLVKNCIKTGIFIHNTCLNESFFLSK